MSLGSCIESIGVQVPERILSTASIVDMLKLQRPLKLELMTGISERRICSEKEDSLTLALGAARDCLGHSSKASGEIEMIIYCAISRYVDGLKHTYEPAMSLLIKDQLGLTQAICFDISNACAGMLTAIHIGSDFIERGVVSNCLVVSGEYISSLSQNAMENIRSPLSPEIASLTLGDAGGAVLLCSTESEQERMIVSKFVTLGEYCNLCIGHQSRKQAGGVMKTQMKKIHDASLQYAPAIVEEALAEAGLRLDQIDHVIPHQTSRQAIRAGRDRFYKYFGAIPKNIVINLEKVGNTASTSHILALYNLLKEKHIKQGDRVMLLSFASGLVIGVVVFSIYSLVDRYGNDN